jgi:hypothetical protein
MNPDTPKVELDAATLRTVGRDFRDVASRLLNSSHHDADANLARFLNFIRANSTIWKYVQDCLVNHPVGERFTQEQRGRFALPQTKDAEIAFTFALLEVTSQSQGRRGMSDIAFAYDTRSLNAGVSAFLREVVAPFVHHITRHLEDALGGVAGNRDAGTPYHIGPGAVIVGGNLQAGIVAAGNSAVTGNVVAFAQPEELRLRLDSLRAIAHELAEGERASFVAALDRLSTAVDTPPEAKAQLVSDIELVASRSSRARETLRDIAVGAVGSLAASGLVQAARLALNLY